MDGERFGASDAVAGRVRFLAAGDRGLAVEFSDAIDRAVSDLVVRTARRVEALKLRGIVELVPTFRSLMVHYDPLAIGYDELVAAIGALDLDDEAQATVRTVWRIPVLYGGEEGPDIEDVAAAAGMTAEDVVGLHSGDVYHVYMLGFLPGYAYLGDVPEPLRMPRRETPRVRVPSGSVAVAGQLSAIYPLESPGGWHLLGRTPVRFFDISRDVPALLAPGDGVRFVPVNEADYTRIAAACEAGDYIPEHDEAGS